MRVFIIFNVIVGAAVVATAYVAYGLLGAVVQAVMVALVLIQSYREGRYDGVKEACDYVEKFAEAQKDRS